MIYIIFIVAIIVCLVLAVNYEIKKNKKLSTKTKKAKRYKIDITPYFKIMTKEEYDEYEDHILAGNEEKYLTDRRIYEFENRLNVYKEINN